MPQLDETCKGGFLCCFVLFSGKCLYEEKQRQHKAKAEGSSDSKACLTLSEREREEALGRNALAEAV